MSTHTASNFTNDNNVKPVWSSRCLNTPKVQSCLLEAIPDLLLHSCSVTWSCASLPRFICQMKTSSRGLQMCSWISDYHQAVSDCKSIPNMGHWPCTVMDSMATHCNTKPSHTHSPMAGALLQISTICCSSKAKSDGQVIQKTQQWQWGHCLWIIWPLVYTI